MSDWHRDAPCGVLSMRPFYFLMSKLVHPHVLTSRDHLLTLMLFPGLLVSLHPRRVRPLKGSGRGCPLLRASSDHRFIVGALRARRAPGHSFPIIPRPRVARAQKIIRLHPLLCSGSKGSARVSFHPFHRAASASKKDGSATPSPPSCLRRIGNGL